MITGGPSTGKTSVIENLQNAGYLCYPEVIRQMTLEAKNDGVLSNFQTNPIASVSNPLDFNTKILTARLDHFNESVNQNEPIIFFDRGMPDVLAYMDYYGQNVPKEFTTVVKKNRYHKVFLLPMWQDIFVPDDERFENYDEALKINECLHSTYRKLGYDVTVVPKSSVEERTAFIIQNIIR